MINRGSVIVRPKKPYIDWAAELEDSPILPEYEGEKTVYLIPEYDDDEHAMQILSEGFDLIFESELYGWHTDEVAWPKNRTFAMFKEWFHIEFNSVVSDLC
ncbi:MAG: hypothetical protein WBN40_05905, partial [Pseudomonadales bacterium]